MRKAIARQVRDKVHTGILNDWFYFMTLSLTVIVITLIIIALG